MSHGHSFAVFMFCIFTAIRPQDLGAQFVSSREANPLPLVTSRLDLALIEAEGLAHPRPPSSHLEPVSWHQQAIRGETERKCVDVPQPGPVRSGEFAVWANGLHEPWVGKQHKIAWMPSENAREMALRVRGRLIGDGNAFFDWTSTAIGRTIGDNQDWFFPSGAVFPQVGEWVLVAESGNNWGCFVFQVLEGS
jgi:hypothetical protein